MKKLLIIHNFYREYGGEDANIFEEIKFFEKNYDVEFFSFDNSQKINFYDLINFIFRTNPKSNKLIEEKINQFNPDVVYIHNIWFKVGLGIFKIFKKNNIKVLVKIHNFRYKCAPHFFSGNHLNNSKICNACGYKKIGFFNFNKYYENSYIKSLWLYGFTKKYNQILKNHDLEVVAITEFHKENLVNFGIPRDKIHIINNPILFEDKIENKQSSNSVIFAGRLSPEKGLDKLLSVWTNLQNNELKLIVIGDGEQKKELESKYSSENIIFLGSLDNDMVKKEIINSLAVITSTTLYEGQPRLLCEASSLKTVSIFPKFGGMEEFFPPNYPFSFEQFNYEDLKLKIELLSDQNTLEDFSEKNYKFLYKKLSPEKIQNLFERVITGV